MSCPRIPETLKRQEQAELSALLDSPMKVLIKVDGHPAKEAELHSDGTFSYDDGEVGFYGLHSAELVWYYTRTTSAEALQQIYFLSQPDKSLAHYVEEFYEDMPGLVTSEPRPPLHLLMARLEDKEALLQKQLREMAAIEAKRLVVADLEQQVRTMKARLGL